MTKWEFGMEMTNWLPEHSAALQNLRARGLSYSEIADAINVAFNTAYTRNAALSRAQRMGLAGLDRPGAVAAGATGSAQAGSAGAPTKQWSCARSPAEPKPDLFGSPRIFAETVEMPPLRCAGVAPRHLSLLELERGDCRYPYGGDADGETMTFCGHPCRPGASYCTCTFSPEPRSSSASAKPVLNDGWLRAVGAG